MTVVEDYQEQTEALAAATAANVLTLYAALRAGGLAPATVVPAMGAAINMANAAATTLADVAVTAQIEVESGVPTPPTGIAPRDQTERLVKAVETILDDADELDDDDQADHLDEDHGDESDEDHGDEPDDADEDHGDEDRAEELDEDHAEEPDDDQAHAEEPRDEGHADEPREDHEPDQGHAHEDHADQSDDAAEDAARMRLERLARSEPLETGQAVTVEIVNRLPQVEGWTRVLDADPCARCVRWAEDGRVFPTGHHFKRHYGCSCQMQIVTKEGTAS